MAASAPAVRQGGPPRRFGAYRPAVGDFDGNGFGDVLWHGTGSAADSIWWLAPAARTAQASRSAAPTARSSATSTATAPTTSSGTPPVRPSDAVWYFEPNRSAPHGVRATRTSSPGSRSSATSMATAATTCSSTAPGPRVDYHVAQHRAVVEVTERSVNGLLPPGRPRRRPRWSRRHHSGSRPGPRPRPGGPSRPTAHTSRSLPTRGDPGTRPSGDFNGDGREDVLFWRRARPRTRCGTPRPPASTRGRVGQRHATRSRRADGPASRRRRPPTTSSSSPTAPTSCGGARPTAPSAPPRSADPVGS